MLDENEEAIDGSPASRALDVGLGQFQPLLGEILQFALMAAIFILGFLPMHLLLRIWKGRTAHFSDAFAL